MFQTSELCFMSSISLFGSLPPIPGPSLQDCGPGPPWIRAFFEAWPHVHATLVGSSGGYYIRVQGIDLWGLKYYITSPAFLLLQECYSLHLLLRLFVCVLPPCVDLCNFIIFAVLICSFNDTRCRTSLWKF
jgi:hypothetical protein